MLNKEVDFLYCWVLEVYDFGKLDEKEKYSVIWSMEWDDIIICYDIKFFNCGVCLIWS